MSQIHVLIDQVGYETQAQKQAIIAGSDQDRPQTFALIDNDSGRSVLQGDLVPSGKVNAWENLVFWTADFSTWNQAGHYKLQVHGVATDTTSYVFEIGDDILERNTLSNVVFYFKGQRSSGEIDQADRHLKVPGVSRGFVDVHGGWYDASGDYGIHLSHQNPTSYFNPQQVPLVAWSLLKSYQVLQARKDDNFSEYERRMLDEGLYGADFLVRMKRPNGSFFETITAPGKEKLPKDRVIGNPNWKTQIKLSASDSTENIAAAEGPHAFEASFRAGGGMAIAALALASTIPIDGEFPRTEYLRTAEDAFHFLNAHNRELLNDRTENILDDYCALLAATELYSATHKDAYQHAADERAADLMARLTSSGSWHDYWRADTATRPYFHPADAGLPVISLLEYLNIAPPTIKPKVSDSVERSLRFELTVTSAWNQLHWILGRNPFDASMLMGSGHGYAPYMFFHSYKYTGAPGGIMNGVTSGLDNEDGIAFNLGYAVTGKDEDWRWTEQWLPHSAWYLYAISLPH
jgi:hypothetical protein